MILASIKLDDDIRDCGSRRSRIAQWLMRRKIAKAVEFFESLDADFARNIKDQIDQHILLEQRANPTRIADYTAPTANAFSYVFGLMAKLHGMSDLLGFFEELGRHIGTAIIAFDCAFDWKEDRGRKQFNPLSTEGAVADAYSLSKRSLEAAAMLCNQRFGSTAISTKTLKSISMALVAHHIIRILIIVVG